jgi:hypothetical protein
MVEVTWDITSITSAHTAAANETAGNYYGTKYGVAGYWIKLPDSAPPIGSITLAASGGNDGVYIRTNSSNTLGVNLAKTIVAYEKGGRWICIGAAGASGLNARHTTGAKRKTIQVHYRAATDYVGPTND